MRKNKFIYTFSALMMACIISFSGVGGSYIQAHATSVGIPRPGAWNDDASVWDNICNYLSLYMSYMGVYVNPSGLYYTAQDFYDFMTSDGVPHDVAHGIFCDCDDSTHTSFSGNEHGGGGFVRDGISVDDDGNVTYSDEVSDLFHGYIKECLDSNSGYILFPTMTVNNVPAGYFSSESVFENFKDIVNSFDVVHLWYRKDTSSLQLFYIPTNHLFSSAANLDPYFAYDYYVGSTHYVSRFVYSDNNNLFPIGVNVVEDDWSVHAPYYLTIDGSETLLLTSSVDYSNFVVSDKTYSINLHAFSDNSLEGLFSKDGRHIKLWYDLDAFKNYDVGYQSYYVTQNWVNYDASQDNSITMTSSEYQYYSDNSTTIFQTIQNNIDNSGSDLTEQDVQQIVDDAVKEIKDSISDNSGSGDNGDSGDNEDSGGSGVGDLIEGIGKIFDTILSLIGKLMGVVADFTQSILDLFSGFTTFTDGFSDFLAGAFSFIPAEVWDIIKVGLSLMVLLAVIKFLRK